MIERRLQTSTGKDLVGFEVGGIAYAIEIQRVREIVRPMRMLGLPQLPEGVIGVVDHRGDVVPIIDLRRRFEVTAAGSERDVRWVIVSDGPRMAGLVVDRVTDVFAARAAEPRELPELGQREAARALRAAVAYEGRLVFVLDVNQLTAPTEDLILPEGDPAALARGVDDTR